MVRIIRLRIMSIFHLLPMSRTVVATGQAGSSSFVSMMFLLFVMKLLYHRYGAVSSRVTYRLQFFFVPGNVLMVKK